MRRIQTTTEVVIGIRQRGGDLRFFHASDVKSGTLAKYIRENVSADVDVMMTDEMPAYPKAMIKAGVRGKKHKTIKHKAKVYVDGDIHTNTVESAFSLLKRGIMGSWHKISAKHLPAYLDEMTFPLQSPEERQSVLGYFAPYGYGQSTDFRETDCLIGEHKRHNAPT